ncbi:MAG: hypothetical protein JST09_17210 [Bacteroidetes bacterium]|nr:hypothetical protein [Bacteroidota bacterium]
MPLFTLFEPLIPGIHFEIVERPSLIHTSWLFAMEMAALPVMVLIIWRLAKNISAVKKVISVAIVIVFMTVAIIYRNYLVKRYFINVVHPFLQNKGQLPMNYPIDPANFVYYLFVGLLLGCFVSYLLIKSCASH